MKAIQLLTLFLFFCFSLFAQSKVIKNTGKYQNDLKAEGLRGKVKSCTFYFYEQKEKQLNENTGWNFSMRLNFNKAGKITDEYVYTDSKTRVIANRIRYVYDTYSRKIRMLRDSGIVMNESQYSFNRKGNLVEISKSNSRISFRFVYTDVGKRDTMYDYDRAGKLNSKVIYRYNAKGYLDEDVRYKADGSAERRQVYRYDNRGNKVQETHYDSGGVVTARMDYTYDNRNNQISALDSNMRYVGGAPAKAIGNNRSLRIYKYDKMDKQGNWLKQNLMIDDKVVRVVKREISYY